MRACNIRIYYTLFILYVIMHTHTHNMKQSFDCIALVRNKLNIALQYRNGSVVAVCCCLLLLLFRRLLLLLLQFLILCRVILWHIMAYDFGTAVCLCLCVHDNRFSTMSRSLWFFLLMCDLIYYKKIELRFICNLKMFVVFQADELMFRSIEILFACFFFLRLPSNWVVQMEYTMDWDTRISLSLSLFMYLIARVSGYIFLFTLPLSFLLSCSLSVHVQ